MTSPITNPAIIGFLQQQEFSAGFFDSLKIRYRSYICPFISLLNMVKPGEKVGDVGCGSGQFLLLVKHFTQASSLFGVEITQRLIDNANTLFKANPGTPYAFSTYDGMTFPKELGEMDVLFLIDVLHHVPKANQEAFLGNLAAIMKPGARLVLKDINAASPFVLTNKMHDLIFAGEIGHELSMARSLGILKSHQLAITEQSKRLMYVYPHYTIVAQKP